MVQLATLVEIITVKASELLVPAEQEPGTQTGNDYDSSKGRSTWLAGSRQTRSLGRSSGTTAMGYVQTRESCRHPAGASANAVCQHGHRNNFEKCQAKQMVVGSGRVI